MRLLIALLFMLPVASFAADKKIAPARAGNDDVELSAMAIVGRQQASETLGVDPAMEMIAVEMTVTPKGDKPLAISRDDFTLISRRDGQRSQAMHPSQLAGSGVMVVSSTTAGAVGGGFGGPRRGPIWGGMPGTGSRPRRIGGDDANTAGVITEGGASAEMKNSENADNPVLAALKARELPLGERKEETRGLLYFFFEGKHKLKDLELMYKKDGATLMLDFQK